jgi:AAA15 family ATPase/GTPase
MLIGFKVRNFRSFADEQEFTFSTSSDSMHAATHCLQTGMKSVRRLSKAAIIFGANGSGKTNMISAFAVMRDLVLHSTIFSDTEFAERHTPFRFGPTSQESTEFEIDLLLGSIRYRYGFSYDSNGIRAERLLVYCTGKSQRWFDRTWHTDAQREEWAPFSQNFSGPRAMWRDATRPNSLFLTTAAQLNAEQLRPLFDWFEHGIELVFPSEPANLARVATSIQDAAFKKQMLQFLQAADIRVHDVRVPEIEAEPAETTGSWFMPSKRARSIPERSVVEFSHVRGDSHVWLHAADESAGTQRLASLFGPLLAAIEQGKLLLIDEFDLSLHPLVARYLLQLINDSSVSDRGAQLLLTSHNTTLMDVNVLRRDEIWLMSLDENDASHLAPVWRAAVPPRKHELIGKGYLRGRYGAVPKIRADSIKKVLPEIATVASSVKEKPKVRFSMKSLA